MLQATSTAICVVPKPLNFAQRRFDDSSSPVGTFFFMHSAPAGTPHKAGCSGHLSEPGAAATKPISGHVPSLSYHLLRRNRTTAVLEPRRTHPVKPRSTFITLCGAAAKLPPDPHDGPRRCVHGQRGPAHTQLPRREPNSTVSDCPLGISAERRVLWVAESCSGFSECQSRSSS
jgi:hypothetical protein